MYFHMQLPCIRSVEPIRRRGDAVYERGLDCVASVHVRDHELTGNEPLNSVPHAI